MQIRSLKVSPIVSIVLLIMVTLFCKPSAVGAASVVRTDKDIYNQGEAIRVHFTNAPGNDSDWMCIAPAGSPDTNPGDYKYMPRGSGQGFLTFGPRSSGKYEVRAYYNYRRNGYVVSGRYAFSVGGDPVREEELAQRMEPIEEPNDSQEDSLPPPIPFDAPPNVVVLPGTDVYVIPDTEVDIFFQGGWWWRQWRGNWYRSTYYDHGWAHYRAYPSWHRSIPHNWRSNYSNHIWGGRPWNPPRINHGNLNNHWRGGHWRSNPGLGRPGGGSEGTQFKGGGREGRTFKGGGQEKRTFKGSGREGRTFKSGGQSERTRPSRQINRSHDGGSNRGDRR